MKTRALTYAKLPLGGETVAAAAVATATAAAAVTAASAAAANQSPVVS